MRVFHAPFNIASLLSHTVRGERAAGIDARGLVVEDSRLNSLDSRYIIMAYARRGWKILWPLNILVAFFHFVRLVFWADVVHWYFGPCRMFLGLDIALIRFLRKPAVVEWLGSEIRVPEREFKDNPYYASAFPNGYEYAAMESSRNSEMNQRYFVKAGFVPIVADTTGTRQYIREDICPRFYQVRQRLILSDFVPRYPDPDKQVPIVAHAPSAFVAKGTGMIIESIEKLKRRHRFEFVLIKDLSRQKALELMCQADIFLDQFVLGLYGMAGLEAMSLGKPVICYIKPSLIPELPEDLPVVNATGDTLTAVLESLLIDGGLRNKIGRSSRAYVEKYHNADVAALSLAGIYREVIAARKNV
jgi:glycosyltransferase involved in cell wall biosynthesis